MRQRSATVLRKSSGLTELLKDGVDLVEGLGEEFAELSQRIGELRERLAENRFHLAVLGQFKRGKSTLLNALLGDEVLPMAVVPATAIPTFIRHGETLGATVEYGDNGNCRECQASGIEELHAVLAGLVTEQGNPKNRLGVSHVTVTHTAAILNHGVVLIDTPGVGSTLHHNSEVALKSLPSCDAAMFVVSPDPPLTEIEVDFLKRVNEKVPRLFFVLNKIDYFSIEERHATLEFLKRTLAEKTGLTAQEVSVFCVSSRQGIVARKENDRSLWMKSGMADLERHLVEFLTHEKSEALHEAIGLKAKDVVGEALLQSRLALESFRLPLEELQRRKETLARTLDDVQRQRQTIADMLAGDRQRIHELLEQHAQQMRVTARGYMANVIERAVEAGKEDLSEETVQDAVAAAIPGCFDRLSATTSELLCTRLTEALRPHQDRVDRLIQAVRREAASLFDIPYHAPESDRAFEMTRQPYWVTHEFRSTLNPIPSGMLDRFLSTDTRRRRILTRLNEQVDSLVLHNVENLRWAVYQNIDRSFRQFGKTVDERLDQVTDSTHGAISGTIEKRRLETEVVAQEMERLEAAVEHLMPLHRALAREAGARTVTGNTLHESNT